MNTSTSSVRQPAILNSLVEVGTLWARHGVGVGISAVRTQAAMLRTASTTLDKAADALSAADKPLTEKKTAGDEAVTVEATVVETPAS